MGLPRRGSQPRNADGVPSGWLERFGTLERVGLVGLELVTNNTGRRLDIVPYTLYLIRTY